MGTLIGVLLLDLAGVACLAIGSWTTLGLWAGASLVAATLLAASMNRRREALTQTLRDHVTGVIGPPAPRPDANATDDDENTATAD